MAICFAASASIETILWAQELACDTILALHFVLSSVGRECHNLKVNIEDHPGKGKRGSIDNMCRYNSYKNNCLKRTVFSKMILTNLFDAYSENN